MSKKRIVEECLYDFGDFCICSDSLDVNHLEEMIKEIKEACDTKYEDLTLRIHGSDYDEDCISLSLVGMRKESDAEFDARIQKEKDYKKKLHEQRRKEYEKLKAEFGDE